jgi:hypothetical protein
VDKEGIAEMLEQADTLLLTASRCASKLKASFSRNEIYPAAEYGWLVEEREAIRDWRARARRVVDDLRS